MVDEVAQAKAKALEERNDGKDRTGADEGVGSLADEATLSNEVSAHGHEKAAS